MIQTNLKKIKWNKITDDVGNELYIMDRCFITNFTWEQLKASGLHENKLVTIDGVKYVQRMLNPMDYYRFMRNENKIPELPAISSNELSTGVAYEVASLELPGNKLWNYLFKYETFNARSTKNDNGDPLYMSYTTEERGMVNVLSSYRTIRWAGTRVARQGLRLVLERVFTGSNVSITKNNISDNDKNISVEIDVDNINEYKLKLQMNDKELLLDQLILGNNTINISSLMTGLNRGRNSINVILNDNDDNERCRITETIIYELDSSNTASEVIGELSNQVIRNQSVITEMSNAMQRLGFDCKDSVDILSNIQKLEKVNLQSMLPVRDMTGLTSFTIPTHQYAVASNGKTYGSGLRQVIVDEDLNITYFDKAMADTKAMYGDYVLHQEGGAVVLKNYITGEIIDYYASGIWNGIRSILMDKHIFLVMPASTSSSYNTAVGSFTNIEKGYSINLSTNIQATGLTDIITFDDEHSVVAYEGDNYDKHLVCININTGKADHFSSATGAGTRHTMGKVKNQNKMVGMYNSGSSSRSLRYLDPLNNFTVTNIKSSSSLTDMHQLLGAYDDKVLVTATVSSTAKIKCYSSTGTMLWEKDSPVTASTLLHDPDGNMWIRDTNKAYKFDTLTETFTLVFSGGLFENMNSNMPATLGNEILMSNDAEQITLFSRYTTSKTPVFNIDAVKKEETITTLANTAAITTLVRYDDGEFLGFSSPKINRYAKDGSLLGSLDITGHSILNTCRLGILVSKNNETFLIDRELVLKRLNLNFGREAMMTDKEGDILATTYSIEYGCYYSGCVLDRNTLKLKNKVTLQIPPQGQYRMILHPYLGFIAGISGSANAYEYICDKNGRVYTALYSYNSRGFNTKILTSNEIIHDESGYLYYDIKKKSFVSGGEVKYLHGMLELIDGNVYQITYDTNNYSLVKGLKKLKF